MSVSTQTPASAIEVEGLSKSDGDVQAVVDLSFSVRQGEIGFLGPNGAGKPLFARLCGRPVDRREAASLLEQVGLAEKQATFPEQLSGGQQQRLSLALALINHPAIVFLDEPTTGMDPQSRRILWEMIRALRQQGKTVVLTTQYMEEAGILGDRVVIIDAGRLVALDTPGALINGLGGLSSIMASAAVSLAALRSLPTIGKMEHDGTRLTIQTCDVALTLRSIQFAAMLLYASLRNWKALALTLGMPLFMLFTIWVPAMTGDGPYPDPHRRGARRTGATLWHFLVGLQMAWQHTLLVLGAMLLPGAGSCRVCGAVNGNQRRPVPGES